MATEILMPALSPTMEEGKLARWLVKEGDEINAGDVIAEIETDKATMEVEAIDDGLMSKLLVAEGAEGVKVNTPIAIVLEEGEEANGAALPVAAPAPTVAEAPVAEATKSTRCPGGSRKRRDCQRKQNLRGYGNGGDHRARSSTRCHGRRNAPGW